LKSIPVLLNSLDDSGQTLKRLESRTGDEKDEKWLQELIFRHPEILPVSGFDESFSPLIPLGREVGTDSGSIDNLYISPVGYITIVETKLWKNPEKHRTVVAQIIDYVKEVSLWDFDQLNKAILKSSRSKNTHRKQSIEQIISPFLNNAGLNLTDFQERVIKNLQSGEFLLLIVGDKISPNVALLSEAIHGVPGLDFRLGLVELQICSVNPDSAWPLILVPDVVGRTAEKTRGVIKIQYVQERPSVQVEISGEEIEPRGKTTPEIFLQKVPSDLRSVYEQWFKIWISKNIYIYWGTTGFSLRPTVRVKLQTVFEAYPEWALSLIREADAERCGATQEQYRRYIEDITPVPQAINILAGGKKFIQNDAITADDLTVILEATTVFAENIMD